MNNRIILNNKKSLQVQGFFYIFTVSKLNVMAQKRKTIEVQVILDYSNKQLARTDVDATKEFKEGIIGLLERVLLDTGNYNGFCFINNDDSEVNTLGHVSRKYF